MDHEQSNVIVYVTGEYGRFKLILGNRRLNEEKISRIIKEITTGNDMLRYYPIQVSEHGEKLEIIDGQHRFHICKKLKVPVYYIVVKEDKSLPDIAKINSNTEKWKATDFINCYLEQKNKDYAILNDFIKKTGFPISLAIRLLDSGHPGNDGSSKSILKQFQYGTFKVKALKEAEEIYSNVALFKPFKYITSRAFVIAIYRIRNAGALPLEEIAAAVRKRPEMLSQQTNYKNYIYQLEQIVNMNKQHRIILISAPVKKEKPPKEQPVKEVKPAKQKPKNELASRILTPGRGAKLFKQEPTKFKTRNQNLDKMVSYKLDHKTTVMAPPGADIEKLRKQFLKNR